MLEFNIFRSRFFEGKSGIAGDNDLRSRDLLGDLRKEFGKIKTG